MEWKEGRKELEKSSWRGDEVDRKREGLDAGEELSLKKLTVGGLT